MDTGIGRGGERGSRYDSQQLHFHNHLEHSRAIPTRHRCAICIALSFRSALLLPQPYLQFLSDAANPRFRTFHQKIKIKNKKRHCNLSPAGIEPRESHCRIFTNYSMYTRPRW